MLGDARRAKCNVGPGQMATGFPGGGGSIACRRVRGNFFSDPSLARLPDLLFYYPFMGDELSHIVHILSASGKLLAVILNQEY